MKRTIRNCSELANHRFKLSDIENTTSEKSKKRKITIHSGLSGTLKINDVLMCF